jgi:hypothetical protein
MMHQLRFFGKSAVLVLFVVGLVASFGGWTQAWGQSNQGAIAGTVLDPSGFAVANASINAIGVDTGSQYHAFTAFPA